MSNTVNDCYDSNSVEGPTGTLTLTRRPVPLSSDEVYRLGFASGVGCGIDRMRSLANDFEAMAGAMAGVPSHWAAQMAKALRRDADAFEEEVRGE